MYFCYSIAVSSLHRIGWIIGTACFICLSLRFVESKALLLLLVLLLSSSSLLLLLLLSLYVVLATLLGETGTGAFLFLLHQIVDYFQFMLYLCPMIINLYLWSYQLVVGNVTCHQRTIVMALSHCCV